MSVDVTAPSEPSGSLKKQVRTLLRKMPQGEADWSSRIPLASTLREFHDTLVLSEASPETRPSQLFEMYSQSIQRSLLKIEAETEVDFLKILALGTGSVLLAEYKSRRPYIAAEYQAAQKLVCDGVRLCFRSAGSVSTLEDKRLVEYMGAVGRGADLMFSLECFFTPRAHELPIHVCMFSLFLGCRSQDVLPYIVHELMLHSYRPSNTWDSTIISIPYLIYCNLGKRYTLDKVYELLGVARGRRVPRVTVDPLFLSIA